MIERAMAGLVAALLMAFSACGAAQAASGEWAKSEHVSARLLSAVGGTGDLATLPGGIELKLEGDWKTYWRSPGDAGLPPTLDWKRVEETSARQRCSTRRRSASTCSASRPSATSTTSSSRST